MDVRTESSESGYFAQSHAVLNIQYHLCFSQNPDWTKFLNTFYLILVTICYWYSSTASHTDENGEWIKFPHYHLKIWLPSSHAQPLCANKKKLDLLKVCMLNHYVLRKEDLNLLDSKAHILFHWIFHTSFTLVSSLSSPSHFPHTPSRLEPKGFTLSILIEFMSYAPSLRPHCPFLVP